MKTKSVFLVLLSWMVAGYGLSSCSKDDSRDASSMTVKMQAVNKRFSLPVGTSALKSALATASMEWNSAVMMVSKLEFEAEMKNSGTPGSKLEIEYEVKGPVEVNLFDTKTNIGSIILPPGVYEEVEFEVHLDKQYAGDKPLIYLAGFYTNAGGSKVPVTFAANENFNFKAEQEGVTVTATENSTYSSLIQIFLDQMMKGINPEDLDNATRTNGEIIISATSNSELYQVIISNFKNHHKFECRGDRDDD